MTLKQTRPRFNTKGAQFAFKFSRSHEVRISPELSHFATFFLERQAKVSIVKSCIFVNNNITFMFVMMHKKKYIIFLGSQASKELFYGPLFWVCNVQQQQ